MSAARISPLHERLASLRPTWGELNGMSMPTAYEGSPATGSPTLILADASPLQRAGLKGPGAAAWLNARGVSVPPRANAWSPLNGGGLVARLGRTEFLIEDGASDSVAVELRTHLAASAPGVYPVLRQDASLVLRGPLVHELFAQTCNVHFAAIPPEERAATMTMMVGVAVTVIDTPLDDKPTYRIWCDGTFGIYLWDTLLEIVRELGGRPAALGEALPSVAANAGDSLGKR